MTSTDITLRPPTAGDHADLVRVYEASRELELAMVPWDAAQKREFAAHQLAAQTAHYREYYPEATESVIELDGQIAGRLYVDRGPEEIAILDITVLPEFRRRGIASKIVRDLQQEAGAEKCVRVFVEDFNAGSKAFFGGLGFRPVRSEGVNVRYEWRERD